MHLSGKTVTTCECTNANDWKTLAAALLDDFRDALTFAAHKCKRLEDAYCRPGFRARRRLQGIIGDSNAWIVVLKRRRKQTDCGTCGKVCRSFYDQQLRRVRDLNCGRRRIYLELSVRRVFCPVCNAVRQERLDFLSDNYRYSKRFAFEVGQRCARSSIKDIARELHLEWHVVKRLEKE